MSNLIKINTVELAPIEYRGARVMTMAMMDAVHQRPDGTTRRTFNEHKGRLIVGEDFAKVSANEIRTHKIFAISSKAHEDVILLTESGYSMLVKSFTDDLAWDVQRQLVKSYFKAADDSKPAPARSMTDPALSAFRTSRAISSNAKTAATICALFPQLGDAARQTIYAKLVNAAAGQEVVPLPTVEDLLSATAVGKIYGVTANAVGKLANAHDLKVDQYGEFAMDKSRYSDKQMPTFRYNAAGVARIGELIRQAGELVQPERQRVLAIE